MLLDFNDNVESVYINNKEVESIQIVDGGYIYQKQDDLPVMILEATDISFVSTYQSNAFIYTGNPTIDWGDGVITHDIDAFYHRYSSRGTYEIIITGNITGLKEMSFYYCSYLTSVELPEGIASLGYHCFNSTSLTSIELPSSITSIGNSCFYNCSSLTSIKLNWETSDTIIPYTWSGGIPSTCKFFIPSGTEQLYIDKGYPSDILITPMTLTVTGSSFSSHNSSLFTYTGDVYVDWGDGVTEQYNGGRLQHTFVDSANTHEITVYGNITSLGDYCFSDCSSLTSITLPNSVTSLGLGCFSNCSSLTSIELPNSITSLGRGCFYECSSLTSITLSNSVTSLGNSCFSGCLSLTSITLPNTIASLGNSCFYRCSSLTSIELPNSITSLGDYCFDMCVSLNSLIFNWETSNSIITYDSSGWADGLSSSCRFSIPLGTTSLYTAKQYPSNRIDERGTPVVQSVSVALSESSITVGQSVTITATVTGTGSMVGKSVTFKSGTTTIGTATIQSGNSVSITYTPTVAGTEQITAVCDNVTSQAVTLTVTEPIPYSIELTADKDTLSNYDHESAVFTATVKQGTTLISGATVEFSIGGTTVHTGTTASDGTVQYTYQSQGVGDVVVTAESMNRSETYGIEDCILYDPLTSNSGKWTIPSAVSSQYSSDGWRMSSSSYVQVKLDYMLTAPCKAEITIVDYNKVSAGASVIIYQYTNGSTTPNQSLIASDYRYTRYEALGQTINHDIIKGGKYAIDYDDTMNVYENGSKVASATNNVGLPTKFEIHIGGGGRYAVYKDLKIKPL